MDPLLVSKTDNEPSLEKIGNLYPYFFTKRQMNILNWLKTVFKPLDEAKLNMKKNKIEVIHFLCLTEKKGKLFPESTKM